MNLNMKELEKALQQLLGAGLGQMPNLNEQGAAELDLSKLNVKIELKDGNLNFEMEMPGSKEEEKDLDPPTKIDEKGTKSWKDKDGNLHRDGDKPALIWFDGRCDHYKHGMIHRDGDLPACYSPNGEKPICYYKNGKLHRDGNKPAVIREDSYEYWVNGKHILMVKHENGVVEV